FLLLGREKGGGDALGPRGEGCEEPPLARVFGEQRAVGGMPPRHDRGLIVLQLGVVRQRLGVVPQQAGRRRDRGDEYDRSRREQQAEEAQQQSHGRRSPCPRPWRPRYLRIAWRQAAKAPSGGCPRTARRPPQRAPSGRLSRSFLC